METYYCLHTNWTCWVAVATQVKNYSRCRKVWSPCWLLSLSIWHLPGAAAGCHRREWETPRMHMMILNFKMTVSVKPACLSAFNHEKCTCLVCFVTSQGVYCFCYWWLGKEECGFCHQLANVSSWNVPAGNLVCICIFTQKIWSCWRYFLLSEIRNQFRIQWDELRKIHLLWI